MFQKIIHNNRILARMIWSLTACWSGLGLFAQTHVLAAERVMLFTEIHAEGWNGDEVQIFGEDAPGSSPEGRALRVECDFSKKDTVVLSKEIRSDLLRPGEHGALELWISSPNLFSIEVGLTRMQNGREAFYSCVVPIQPGQGWSRTVVPFEELRRGLDSVAADPAGFSQLRVVAHRPVKTRAVGDGKRSGTLEIADFAFVACAPREGQDFPKEVQRLQLEDVVLPDWDGALGIKNMPWDEMIRLADSDPDLAQQFDSWRIEVEKWAGEPLVKRAKTWEEVVAAGWDDPRAHRMDPPLRDRFGVALASGRPWHILARRLPLAALVVRQTGDPLALDYLNRQLAECAGWFPLQMQGWMLNMPPEGDGPWLTECFAMIPLALALDINGDQLDPDVRAAVRELIQKTVDWIDRAWQEEIPWYVKSRAYRSNQWALPAAALSLGCLVLEEEGNRVAYELGVRSLAQHLYAQGESGSFSEGFSYGDMTMQYLMPVLWMMDRSGDQRLSNIPFVENFAAWHHQMNLPGKKVVNYGDNESFNRHSALRRFLMISSLMTGDPGVFWGNERFYPNLDAIDLFSAVYQAELKDLPDDRPMLPAYAWFADQQLAVWRSGWSDNDVALWIKGGTLNDFHYHSDQGHISVMNGKEVLLLDPGSVNYGDPDYPLMFKSSAGHNILQTAAGRLENKLGRRGRVPVTVERIDFCGGAVEIDGSELEFEVRSWKRRIEWARVGQVTVEDRATLFQPRAGGEEWFRWHTGSTEKPSIQKNEDRSWLISWKTNKLTLTADRELLVDAVLWRNSVLDAPHYCVVVKAAETGDELGLTTTLSFVPAQSGQSAVSEEKCHEIKQSDL